MKRTRESAFTLVEIMIVVAIIALLAAIAIPNVLRGRVSANETTAIGNIRALMSSLEMARSVNNQYPTLGVGDTWILTMYTNPNPDFGPPSFNVAMTGTLVQGYNYTYGAGATPGLTYTLLATPSVVGQTGSRSFFANENGVVHHCMITTAALGTAALGSTWATIDAVPTSPCT